MNTKLLSMIAAPLALVGCVNFAPPTPLATLGGPETARRGGAEIAVAAGSGVVSTGLGSGGGHGALVRARYGVTDKFDLGADLQYARYEERDSVAVKAAARWRLAPQWRLELGLGVADSADGRGANGDLGITWGTLQTERHWNVYSSLRLGASRGSMGNFLFDFDREDGSEPDAPLPDAMFGVLSFGGQWRLSADRRFVCEAGIGALSPEDGDSATLSYIAVGLLFDVGGRQ